MTDNKIEHKEVLGSYKKFRQDLRDYFGNLPTDLRITLEEIGKYIERNKK